nr:hypothetical protein Itr_chr07CG03610 [Ipomoea trifida]
MRILGDLSSMKPRHVHYPSNPQPNIAYREGLMKPYYFLSCYADKLHLEHNNQALRLPCEIRPYYPYNSTFSSTIVSIPSMSGLVPDHSGHERGIVEMFTLYSSSS